MWLSYIMKRPQISIKFRFGPRIIDLTINWWSRQNGGSIATFIYACRLYIPSTFCVLLLYYNINKVPGPWSFIWQSAKDILHYVKKVWKKLPSSHGCRDRPGPTYLLVASIGGFKKWDNFQSFRYSGKGIVNVQDGVAIRTELSHIFPRRKWKREDNVKHSG